MKKNHSLISLFTLVIFISSACKKTSSTPSEKLTDYLQLKAGSTITYRLDSINYISPGTVETITSYLVKDVVDTLTTDNLGRASWRVFRYITDTAQSQPWTNLETYFITPAESSVEFIENNLRYIRLTAPLEAKFSWQGNSLINTYTPDYNYLSSWNYTYESIGSSYNVIAGNIPGALVIQQTNSFVGDTTDTSIFSEKIYSGEVYAKGIGLIYKDFLYWQYQPQFNDINPGYRTGYGIRLNMISHN
ncbi:MAG TPA: hypothetical protein VKT28_21495 [Puia sp.]|nr:hypothetical protein [Puia sp.]